MEYMPNGSLRKKIGKNGMEQKEAVEIAVKVLNTLYYIHHYGIVHRDIKPENVVFSADDEPKLTDFGLGKALGKASKSSQGFSGTIEYSAPEQLSKRKYGNVDWRTDIYQVGAMLYEMLSSRSPFEGEDLGEMTTSILIEEPERIDGIDKRLNEIVLRALEKKKEDRWQGAMDMKRMLEELDV
jgi:serine/threonine protein kinase